MSHGRVGLGGIRDANALPYAVGTGSRMDFSFAEALLIASSSGALSSGPVREQNSDGLTMRRRVQPDRWSFALAVGREGG